MSEVILRADTLSELAQKLMREEDIVAVDICEDSKSGLSASWAEVAAKSLPVPDVVLETIVRSHTLDLYDIDHRGGYAIITVLGPNGGESA